MWHKHSAPGGHDDETPAPETGDLGGIPSLLTLPALGDPDKRFAFELSEPEVIALAALYGYVKGQVVSAEYIAALVGPGSGTDAFVFWVARWWAHYGPTLEALNDRMEKLDR